MQQAASNLSAVMASAEDQKARELTGVILPNTVFSGQEYWIDEQLLAGLRAVKARDGISESEQIRRAVGRWLTERDGRKSKAERPRAVTRKRS